MFNNFASQEIAHFLASFLARVDPKQCSCSRCSENVVTATAYEQAVAGLRALGAADQLNVLAEWHRWLQEYSMPLAPRIHQLAPGPSFLHLMTLATFLAGFLVGDQAKLRRYGVPSDDELAALRN